MSETLERIEREIAREVLDAVASAAQDEIDAYGPRRPGEERVCEAFVYVAIGRVERKYGVSREPRGGYE